MMFKVNGWDKLRYHKDRNPTWIALQLSLLDDMNHEEMSDAARWHLAAIWLLAARLDRPREPGYEDGPELRMDPEWIKRKCGLHETPDLKDLVSRGYITAYRSVQNCTESVQICGTSSCTSTSSSTDNGQLGEGVTAALEHLNSKAGTSYRAKAEGNRRHVRARLNEGRTLDDLKTVIDYKCREWKGTDMAKFLRPETIFGPKFEGYLQAALMAKKPSEKKEYVPPWEDEENC